jgi:hypothetical protein
MRGRSVGKRLGQAMAAILLLPMQKIQKPLSNSILPERL